MKNIEEMKAKIDAGGFTGNHVIYFQNSEGKPEYVSSFTCTGSFASMPSATTSPVVGIRFLHSPDNEVAQDFVDWVTGPTSVYAPLFTHLGEDYHLVRNKAGKVIGAVISGDCNFKVMINFFKSARTVTEHSGRLPFWKKWKMEAGMEPSLVYLLMFFFSVQGVKSVTGHSPIESAYEENKVSLKKFLNKGVDYWGVDKETRIKGKTRALSGENKLMWFNGSFEPGKITKAGYVKIPSYFYEKYNKEIPGKYSDEDFKQFFSDVMSDNGKYVID